MTVGRLTVQFLMMTVAFLMPQQGFFVQVVNIHPHAAERRDVTDGAAESQDVFVFVFRNVLPVF